MGAEPARIGRRLDAITMQAGGELTPPWAPAASAGPLNDAMGPPCTPPCARVATWFDFARAYLAKGNDAAFTHVCEAGTTTDVSDEVERFFGYKPIYEQIQFWCGLAALNLAKAKIEKDRQKRLDLISLAQKHLNSAKLMDDKEQLVHMGLGLLHMTKVCAHACMHVHATARGTSPARSHAPRCARRTRCPTRGRSLCEPRCC